MSDDVKKETPAETAETSKIDLTPPDKLVDLNDPSSDYVTNPGGKHIYLDKGSSIVSRMNKKEDKFNSVEFIQELHDNYLSVVQSGAERISKGNVVQGIWDLSSTFFDFLEDAVPNLQRQLESISFAREAKVQKMSIFEDSALAEMKIDTGSAQVGREFDIEDYEATEEILRRSLELIKDIQSEKITIIFDTKSCNIRLNKTSIQV